MNNSDNIIDQALGVFDPVETELKKATTKKAPTFVEALSYLKYF